MGRGDPDYQPGTVYGADALIMNYEFSLDKKKTVILFSGLGLLGTLLFIAGFMIGYGLRPPTLPAGALVAQKPSKGKLAPPAAPKTISFAKPLPANPPSTSAAASGTSAQAPANAPTSAPAPVAATTPNPPSAATAAGTSTATKASAPSPSTNASGKAYSIQMGAFLDPNNAARLVKNLKGLGYDATIFKAPDHHGRIWEAVRLGRYDDLKDAMHAATEFRTKEQMFALVRPADTL